MSRVLSGLICGCVSAMVIIAAGAEFSVARDVRFAQCPSWQVLYGSHCDTIQAEVWAFNRTGFSMVNTIGYKVIEGPGTIDVQKGLWRFVPSIENAGEVCYVTVQAYDLNTFEEALQPCRFVVAVSPNRKPTLSLSPGVSGNTYYADAPGSTLVDLQVSDANPCDQVTLFVKSVVPTPVGYASTIGSTQLLFRAEAADADQAFEVIICATDGRDTTCETATFTTGSVTPYRLEIETTEDAIQGQHQYLDVTMTWGQQPMGGFDLLMAHDRSVLNFQAVQPGLLFDPLYGCDWEYFTYRRWFWPLDGMIRVVALADINDGANHPSCYILPSPFNLFTIDFLVTDNRIYECQFTPVSFFWTDCGDNTISSILGETVRLSRLVYDSDGKTEISDPHTGFPTYTGVQEECLEYGGYGDPILTQSIDFVSGGVNIICANPIDDRGDVNLNGVVYEIADLILFANYFLYGTRVFTINLQGQIAATDMNNDGLTLDIADFVYGVHVIIGDALPHENVCDDVQQAGVLFINNLQAKTVEIQTPDSIGGVYLEFDGNAGMISSYHANMDLRYTYDRGEDVTRAVVYSLDGSSFAEGLVVFYTGNAGLVNASAGSRRGCHLDAEIRTIMPASADGLTLHQNHPNPFNNSTVISFELNHAARVELEVVNVLGQVVYRHGRHYDAGHRQIEWNGTSNSGMPVASGVYYYRLSSDTFSQTKKMILLK